VAAASIEEGHAIAVEVRHRMIQCLSYLSNVVVLVDPSGSAGKHFSGSLNTNTAVCLPNPTKSSGLSGYNPEISAPLF